MPSTYAHYTFGKEVYNRLNEDVKRVIANNSNMFAIGLHGPDILFYYRPYWPNKINQMGITLHRKVATSFFKNARKVINKDSNKEATLAYILGFICHFMLDSECHPYVNKAEKEGLYSHSEIETEFERFLIKQDLKDPFLFKPTRHIQIDKQSAKFISCFMKGITLQQAYKSVKSMRFYLDLLVTKSHIKRVFFKLILFLSGHYKSLSGLIMKLKENKEFKRSNDILYNLYQRAIIPTSDLINEYYRNLNTTSPLGNRFNRNYY